MNLSVQLGQGDEAVVLLSGGMDSTTLLYLLKALGIKVRALSIYYDQRHSRELWAAERLCSQFEDVPWHSMSMDQVFENFQGTGSALLNKDVPVPEGHYAEPSMKQTVVPNRNMILLSLATAYAISNGVQGVAYAAHAGDHAIYPDCRKEFVEQMAGAVGLADWSPVQLTTPFIDLMKWDIASLGTVLGVPYDLTWSCYKGGAQHCHKCGTCVERDEALANVSRKDGQRILDEIRLGLVPANTRAAA